MSVYKDQLNEWVADLNVEADVVFDIGGAQNPIKGRTNTWQAKEYYIIDLETPHVTKQQPDIVHDMNKAWVGLKEADLIFMLGVMDYVINPNIAMRNVYEMLTDDGEAWIEWPLFYGHHEPLWDEGCRYSEGCIMRLLKQADLKLEEIIRKPAGNPLLVEFMRQDGQRLAKNYKYHDTVGFITKVSKA